MQDSQHQQLHVLAPFASSAGANELRPWRSWASPASSGRCPPPSSEMRHQSAGRPQQPHLNWLAAGKSGPSAERRKVRLAGSNLQQSRKERARLQREQGTGAENCCDKLHHGICFSHFTCTPLQAIAAVDTCAIQSQTPAASPSPCHSPGTADPCLVVSVVKAHQAPPASSSISAGRSPSFFLPPRPSLNLWTPRRDLAPTISPIHFSSRRRVIH